MEQDINLQSSSVESELNEIDKLKEEIKQEIKQQVSLKSRPGYLTPLTKYAKAEMPIKLIKVGSGMGFHLQKDVIFSMGLRKGQIIKVTLELYPNDELELLKNA